MQYQALACDYDGTLAREGRVLPEVVAGIERLRRSGRRFIVVTGRRLAHLESAFPHLDLLDLVVAENGATLYDPATRRETVLAPAPPLELDRRLAAAGVRDLHRGSVILGAKRVHEDVLRATIAQLGLDLELIFNLDSVMILPRGVDKSTGLATALDTLKIPPSSTVGMGDAENDVPFLRFCGLGIAVANALPALKDVADAVTTGTEGAGVLEVIEGLLGSDLATFGARAFPR